MGTIFSMMNDATTDLLSNKRVAAVPGLTDR